VRFGFADYVLDVARRELWRGSEPVALEPQVFDLLAHLIRNRDRVVSKDDLLESVWCGRVISESTLTSRINATRKAVGDSGEAQRLIRTVPRKGFRFIAEVAEEDATRGSAGHADLGIAEQARRGQPGAPRLSIVVLPFDNLSGDPAQEYFADGITENLTTDLSLIPESFVIARGTAFTYKGKAIDVRQVAASWGFAMFWREVSSGSALRFRSTRR
jgi:DNA-binding winged helix-turn-helix (wHTH) protein